MAEKLKSESELFTLSLCTNCDNAPIGEQCVVVGKTTNLPDDVVFGIVTTYDTKSYGSGGYVKKIQKLVGQQLGKTIIATRGYGNNTWTEWC